jgi:hypothetical protein
MSVKKNPVIYTCWLAETKDAGIPECGISLPLFF